MARVKRQIIGRLTVVGLGVEATRGTAAAITTLIPFQNYTLRDIIEYIDNDSAFGNIAEFNDSVPYRYRSEGDIGGKVFLDLLGTEFTGVFGDPPISTQLVAGEAYRHDFVMADDNSHQSLTVGVEDSSQNLRYPLVMVNSYTLEASVEAFLTRTINVMGAPSVDSADPINAAYNTNDIEFVPEDIVVTAVNHGTPFTDPSARTLNITTFSITINKNTAVEYTMGRREPVDIVNQQLGVEVSFEGSTINDADRQAFRSGIAQALRFRATKNSVWLDTAQTLHPTLEIQLPKVAFKEYEKSSDLNAAATQSITGQANYDIATAALIKASITNSTASY